MKLASPEQLAEILWSLSGWGSIAFCAGGLYLLISLRKG